MADLQPIESADPPAPATDIDLIDQVMNEKTDDADFEALAADDDAQSAQQEPQAQPRDESGRFASPKAEEKAPERTDPTQSTQDDRTGQIPAWRLREEAEAKRELQAKYEAAERERQQYQQRLQEIERRLQEQQPKAQQETRPDPLIDPDGYARWLEARQSEQLLNERREWDLKLTQQRHGQVFDAAYAEAMRMKGTAEGEMLKAMVSSAPSPGEALVNWYQTRQIRNEVGTDLNAWKQRVLDEALKDPAYLAKAIEAGRSQAAGSNGSRPNTTVQLPPSLSRTANAVARSDADDEWGGDPIYSALRR